MTSIKTVFDFNREIDNEFEWPGGYQRFFITIDGDVLSFKAARENANLIRDSIIGKVDDGWWVIAVEINWED